MFIHRNRATHAPAVSLRGAAGCGQGASTGAAGRFRGAQPQCNADTAHWQCGTTARPPRGRLHNE
jgi:hypothetical protein